MNVQSVSVQHLNWNNISQFTLSVKGFAVSCVTQRLNVKAPLNSTSRSVLQYTISAPFCCDYERCVWTMTVNISWQINSVCSIAFALFYVAILFLMSDHTRNCTNSGDWYLVKRNKCRMFWMCACGSLCRSVSSWCWQLAKNACFHFRRSDRFSRWMPTYVNFCHVCRRCRVFLFCLG